jgi:hypothetical protein
MKDIPFQFDAVWDVLGDAATVEASCLVGVAAPPLMWLCLPPHDTSWTSPTADYMEWTVPCCTPAPAGASALSWLRQFSFQLFTDDVIASSIWTLPGDRPGVQGQQHGRGCGGEVGGAVLLSPSQAHLNLSCT